MAEGQGSDPEATYFGTDAEWRFTDSFRIRGPQDGLVYLEFVQVGPDRTASGSATGIAGLVMPAELAAGLARQLSELREN